MRHFRITKRQLNGKITRNEKALKELQKIIEKSNFEKGKIFSQKKLIKMILKFNKRLLKKLGVKLNILPEKLNEQFSNLNEIKLILSNGTGKYQFSLKIKLNLSDEIKEETDKEAEAEGPLKNNPKFTFRKLTNEQICAICKESSNDTLKNIAKKYNISISTVSRIKNKKLPLYKKVIG